MSEEIRRTAAARRAKLKGAEMDGLREDFFGEDEASAGAFAGDICWAAKAPEAFAGDFCWEAKVLEAAAEAFAEAFCLEADAEGESWADPFFLSCRREEMRSRIAAARKIYFPCGRIRIIRRERMP